MTGSSPDEGTEIVQLAKYFQPQFGSGPDTTSNINEYHCGGKVPPRRKSDITAIYEAIV